MSDGKVVWCKNCGRSVGIGCDCGRSFKDRMKDKQINRFSLKDKDAQRAEPKNRGRNRRKLK